MTFEITLPELHHTMIFLGGMVAGALLGAVVCFCIIFWKWGDTKL